MVSDNNTFIGAIVALATGSIALVSVLVQEWFRKNSAAQSADVTAEIARINSTSRERIESDKGRHDRVEALERRIDEMFIRIQDLTVDNARLTGHDAFQDLEIERITKENASLTAEVQLLQAENKVLRTKLNEVIKERDAYKASLSELQSKLGGVR